MIRLGLIGCGEHSETGHAIPLARYRAAHPSEVVLAAACDIQPSRAQRFCSQYGFEAAYSNVDEMLSREHLDGCIAVVPPERISALGIDLLRRRVPCCVEKPLGATLQDVRALCAAAASTGTPNMVSVNRRFMPFLDRALEWARGAGSFCYVRCTMMRHSRSEPEFIWATAVHAADTLRHIAGDIASFDVETLSAGREMPAWYAVNLQFKNEIMGRIDVLPTAGMVEETYDLFGEDFRVSVTCPFGRQRGWSGFRNGVVAAEELATSDIPEDVLNGCYDEAIAFITALRDGRCPRPTILDVAPSVELCMSIANTRNSQSIA